jgi:hypothetical protein
MEPTIGRVRNYDPKKIQISESKNPDPVFEQLIAQNQRGIESEDK